MNIMTDFLVYLKFPIPASIISHQYDCTVLSPPLTSTSTVLPASPVRLCVGREICSGWMAKMGRGQPNYSHVSLAGSRV